MNVSVSKNGLFGAKKKKHTCLSQNRQMKESFSSLSFVCRASVHFLNSGGVIRPNKTKRIPFFTSTLKVRGTLSSLPWFKHLTLTEQILYVYIQKTKHSGGKHQSNVNMQSVCWSVSVKAEVKLQTDADFISSRQGLLGETPSVYTEGPMKVHRG